MQSHRKILFLLLAAAALFAMTMSVAGRRGQAQEKQAATVKPRDEGSYGPITDFANAEETADPVERNIRRARGKRHDVPDTRFMLGENSPASSLTLMASHSPVEPALPASESDTVLVGEVTNASAHLTNTRTNIYSEFDVRIEEVLKNSGNHPLSQGDSIVAERFGGRVRLPSGKILVRGFIRKTLPREGRRYLFFLKRNEESEDFSILTGYELSDGRVFPLDGVDIPPGGRKLPQFAPYDGVDEARFLAEVHAAIAAAAAQHQP